MSYRDDCASFRVETDHGWNTALCGGEEICECPEACEGFVSTRDFLAGIQDRLYHERQDSIAVARGAAHGE